jgi:hypothetical protein
LWNLQVKPFGSGIFLIAFKITNLIFLLLIGLFEFHFSSWVSFGSLCFPSNFSISFSLSNFLAYNCWKIFHCNLLYFYKVGSAVPSFILGLINWSFSHFFLVSPIDWISSFPKFICLKPSPPMWLYLQIPPLRK